MDNFLLIKNDDMNDRLIELDSKGNFICHTEKIKELVKNYGKLEAENKRLKKNINELIEYAEKEWIEELYNSVMALKD